ncbi:hypothetical protein ASC71_11375 [Rhizobium sp. Root1240]|nr:hypothetical protein ASC71_11375 [Rhizobium sp. Root1240]
MLIWLAATGVTLPEIGPPAPPKPAQAATKEGASAEVKSASGSTDTPATPPLPPGTPPTPSPDPRDTPDGKNTPTTPPPDKPQPTEQAPDDQKTDPATPEEGAKPASENGKAEGEEPEAKAPPPPPDPAPVSETPEDLAMCLRDLKAMGAEFTEDAAIDDETGCGIAHPVTVSRILPTVTLEPGATIRCETALSLARMTRDLLIPAAARAFPNRPALSGIAQASGYVCRNRNSAETGKISEHAHGNAIDIAALSFGKENVPLMIAKQDDGTAEAAFQRALNAIACLYFTTVLSPGSDAAHQDHLHLDVIERKSGFRYCR